MNRRSFSFILLATLIFGALQPLLAESREEIRQRMAERLPQVEALKTSGSFGENNLGLLEARENLGNSQEQLMAAENKDRQAVYRLIASAAGVSAGDVAKQRAAQIRQRSASGIWLQAPNGSWYQK